MDHTPYFAEIELTCSWDLCLSECGLFLDILRWPGNSDARAAELLSDVDPRRLAPSRSIEARFRFFLLVPHNRCSRAEVQ